MSWIDKFFGRLRKNDVPQEESGDIGVSTDNEGAPGTSPDKQHQKEGQNPLGTGTGNMQAKGRSDIGEVVDQSGLEIKQEMIEEYAECVGGPGPSGQESSSLETQESHRQDSDSISIQSSTSENLLDENLELPNSQESAPDKHGETAGEQGLNDIEQSRCSFNKRTLMETKDCKQSAEKKALTRKPLKAAFTSNADKDVVIVSARVRPVATIIKQEMIDDYLQSEEYCQSADYKERMSKMGEGNISLSASNITERHSSVESSATSSVAENDAVSTSQHLIQDYLQSAEFRQSADNVSEGMHARDVGEGENVVMDVVEPHPEIGGTEMQALQSRQSQIQEVSGADFNNPKISPVPSVSTAFDEVHSEETPVGMTDHSGVTGYQPPPVNEVTQSSPEPLHDIFPQPDLAENLLSDATSVRPVTCTTDPPILAPANITKPVDGPEQQAPSQPSHSTSFIPIVHNEDPDPVPACTTTALETNVSMETEEMEVREKTVPVLPKSTPIGLEIEMSEAARNRLEEPVNEDPDPIPACTTTAFETNVSMETEEMEGREKTVPVLPKSTHIGLEVEMSKALGNSVEEQVSEDPDPIPACTTTAFETNVSMETEEMEVREKTVPLLPKSTPIGLEVEMSEALGNSAEEPVSLELKREMLEDQEQSNKMSTKRTKDMAFGVEADTKSPSKKRITVVREMVEKVVIDLTLDDEEDETQEVLSEVSLQPQAGCINQPEKTATEGQGVKVELEAGSAIRKPPSPKSTAPKKRDFPGSTTTKGKAVSNQHGSKKHLGQKKKLLVKSSRIKKTSDAGTSTTMEVGIEHVISPRKASKTVPHQDLVNQTKQSPSERKPAILVPIQVQQCIASQTEPELPVREPPQARQGIAIQTDLDFPKAGPSVSEPSSPSGVPWGQLTNDVDLLKAILPERQGDLDKVGEDLKQVAALQKDLEEIQNMFPGQKAGDILTFLQGNLEDADRVNKFASWILENVKQEPEGQDEVGRQVTPSCEQDNESNEEALSHINHLEELTRREFFIDILKSLFPDCEPSFFYTTLQDEVDPDRVKSLVSKMLIQQDYPQRKQPELATSGAAGSSSDQSRGPSEVTIDEGCKTALKDFGEDFGEAAKWARDAEILKALFPDCQPAFIYSQVQSSSSNSQHVLRQIVAMWESQDYPRLADSTVPGQEDRPEGVFDRIRRRIQGIWSDDEVDNGEANSWSSPIPMAASSTSKYQ